MRIDLNSDLGESFGSYRIGADQEVLQLVSSANIACGVHAGDFSVMHKTLRLAAKADVAVGAHPGLPDLQGFGRRWMDISPEEVYDLVLYQIGAMEAMTRAEKIPLSHVKPHGALYNRAAVDSQISAAIARAVWDFSPSLKLFGLSGSRLVEAGRAQGLITVSEVFADRQYTSEGTLLSRSHPQAMLHSPQEIAERVVRMIEQGSVVSWDGEKVPLQVETICLHGDEPQALATAQAIRAALLKHGIEITSP
ncbi:MAG: LamB/YcsF family protein [Desulfitobacteriaceae bacterium]